MKKLSNQEMKKIAKSTLALVLAGAFTFSPIALAEENSAEFETVELQTTENPTTSVSEEEIDEAKTQVEELEETNPALIPGDFFYFAKIAFEKIKLAFTIDDAKEAELLATYASERLAEASALFADGKETEALQVIEAAVEYMENSQDIVDDQGQTPEEEIVEDEDGSVEGEDSETVVDPESPEADPAEPVEVPDTVEEDETAENPFDEIENVLRQNIIALTAALEKVQNPTARAALQKNIDKTHAKMAKKLAKIEKKYGAQPEEEVVTETSEELEVEPIEVAPDLQPADQIEEQSSETAHETMPVEDNDAKVIAPVVTPESSRKGQAKQQHKVEKAQVKQEQKAEKQVAKQQKTEVKQQKKQEKQEAKQQKTEVKQQKKQEKQEHKVEHKQQSNNKGNEGKGKEKN
jgi:hypothetical protein